MRDRAHTRPERLCDDREVGVWPVEPESRPAGAGLLEKLLEDELKRHEVDRLLSGLR